MLTIKLATTTTNVQHRLNNNKIEKQNA